MTASPASAEVSKTIRSSENSFSDSIGEFLRRVGVCSHCECHLPGVAARRSRRMTRALGRRVAYGAENCADDLLIACAAT